jgi:plasmid stabilization system protein ParE
MAGRRKKRLEWHEDAFDELAEALAWYEELNPAAARRMKSAILAAASSLVAEPVSVPGRPGILAGTRELPVGHRVPFTLVFVRSEQTGDCTVYHCLHQAREYFNH